MQQQLVAQLQALVFSSQRLVLGWRLLWRLGVSRSFVGFSFQGLELEGWALETEAEHVCGGVSAGSARSRRFGGRCCCSGGNLVLLNVRCGRAEESSSPENESTRGDDAALRRLTNFRGPRQPQQRDGHLLSKARPSAALLLSWRIPGTGSPSSTQTRPQRAAEHAAVQRGGSDRRCTSIRRGAEIPSSRPTSLNPHGSPRRRHSHLRL